MLEILPLRDKERMKRLCTENNINTQEEILAYEALFGTQSLGYCLFWLGEEKVVIAFVSLADEKDIYLLDGLVRAAMAYGLQRGAKWCEYENKDDMDKLKILGLLGKEQKLQVEIKPILEGCHCHK